MELKPFDMAKSASGYDLPKDPIHAMIAVEDVVADKIPGLVEQVGLSKVNAEIIAQLDPAKHDLLNAGIVGDAQVRRTKVDRPVTTLHYDLKAAKQGDQLAPTGGTLDLKNVSMKHLEAILGQEKGGLSQWAGDKGNVGINFTTPAKDAYQANIKTQLPNLAGEFDASIENASQANAMVSLTAKTSTLTRLPPASAAATAATAAARS